MSVDLTKLIPLCRLHRHNNQSNLQHKQQFVLQLHLTRSLTEFVNVSYFMRPNRGGYHLFPSTNKRDVPRLSNVLVPLLIPTAHTPFPPLSNSNRVIVFPGQPSRWPRSSQVHQHKTPLFYASTLLKFIFGLVYATQKCVPTLSYSPPIFSSSSKQRAPQRCLTPRMTCARKMNVQQMLMTIVRLPSWRSN